MFSTTKLIDLSVFFILFIHQQNLTVRGIEYSENDLMKIANDLETLGCQALQIRFYSNVASEKFDLILSYFKFSRIRHIDIIGNYDVSFTQNCLDELFNTNQRLAFITLFASPFEKSISFHQNQEVFYRKGSNHLPFSCGKFNPYDFMTTMELFTESHHHNSCLNRKISIDAEGNIKNCPSMRESYGNIKDTTLMEAVEKPGFKKYWNITKDSIAVCKDCEFRYVCTDCRAYIEDPEDIYSKPLKCGYNPYTAEWEEWSTHPMKQKAIDFYGMREVLPEFQMKEDYVPQKKA